MNEKKATCPANANMMFVTLKKAGAKALLAVATICRSGFAAIMSAEVLGMDYVKAYDPRPLLSSSPRQPLGLI